MSSAVPTAPEHIELTCDVCQEVLEGGAPGFPNSAKFKLASHRYRVHGIKKDGTVRAKKATTKELREHIQSEIEDAEVRPILAAVKDIADDLDKGKGAPSEAQLVNALGRTVGLASTGIAGLIADTDDGLTEQERDEVIAYLSVSDRAAKDIVRPLAHLAAPTKLNKRYGRQAVENVDVVGSLFEITELALHYRRYMRDRKSRKMPPVIDAASYPSSPAPPVVNDSEGWPVDPGGTATTAEVVLTGGAPSAGVLWTPEMVGKVKSGRS